jgi:Mg/Co/Ni transporter MgtE
MLRAMYRLRSLKVSDVMSRQVVEVGPDQPLDEVAELFAAKDVSSAPVINQNRQALGC